METGAVPVLGVRAYERDHVTRETRTPSTGSSPMSTAARSSPRRRSDRTGATAAGSRRRPVCRRSSAGSVTSNSNGTRRRLPARVEDVRTLYTSPDTDEKAAILRRYNVEYVVVGDLERVYPMANNECTPTGSADGHRRIRRHGRHHTRGGLHASRGTTIYRVLPVRPA